MSRYETIITSKTGQTLAALSGARDRWWNRELNRPGAAGFTISPLDPQITADLLRHKELYFYRNGTLLWGGTILTRRSDVGSEPPGTISVTAQGFLERLGKKVIGTIADPRTFTDDDLGLIAETIRSETQTGTNADVGVLAGAQAVSRDGDRTYKYENAKEALEGLSNLRVENGVDIDVDANKQLSTFYPSKGRSREDIVFEWGKNVTSYYAIDDTTDMANQIIVVGKEDSTDTPVVVRNGPAFLQTEHGILQDVITRYNVTNTATLAEWGDRELAKRQSGRQLLGVRTKGNLAPVLGSYDVGDLVRVRISYGIDAIDALYRITAIHVRITDTDEEDIELQFGTEDDVGSKVDELEERLENLETAA